MTQLPAVRPLPRYLFAGFALASVGGPLALVALFIPDAVGGTAIGSTGLVVAAGAALFVAPLVVWMRYSAYIASDGGLYEFTRQAAGTRVARVHGTVWAISYFLYLPATVTFLAYDVLPVGFPGIVPYRGWIQALSPLVVVGLVAGRERVALWLVAAIGVAQVLVLAVFAVVLRDGVGTVSWAAAGDSHQVARGAANVALLFVCASLPLYLGGEVAGGTRTIRRTLAGAVAAAAALAVGGSFAYSGLASSAVASLPVPGYTFARIYAGPGFAALLLAGAAASVAALIIAEYIALTRLLRAMTGLPVRRGALLVGGLFVTADVATLTDPGHLYDHALTLALVALFVSQAIAFAAYPLYARRHRTLVATDLVATSVAVVLMAFGLCVAVSQATT